MYKTKNLQWNRETIQKSLKNVSKSLFAVVLIVFLLPSCGERELEPNQMRDRVGNIYSTVTIGSQEWMAENLNARFTNASNISSMPNNERAVYSYPGGNEQNVGRYGRLYTVQDARVLLPREGGWRIPTLADFERLMRTLDVNYADGASEVRTALGIDRFPGTNVSAGTMGATFMLMLDEPANVSNMDFLAIRFNSRDLPGEGLTQRNIYIRNITRGVAGSVRFVRDVQPD